MQRLHLDDPVGHVLEQEGWEGSHCPRSPRRTRPIASGPATASTRHTRRAGEALHPQRESLNTLAKIRANLGEYHFAGQYQQNPVPLGGGLVKQT